MVFCSWYAQKPSNKFLFSGGLVLNIPVASLMRLAPNGHGNSAAPHLNPLPQAGEEANESLREFHVNGHGKCVAPDLGLISIP